MISPTASAKAALRALARRWLMLDAEIKSLDAALVALTAACAPALKEAHGMSTGTAAEMLSLVGDNPERIRSDPAFAKLCGACPIPASSGKTTRHWLNRGGDRQANAAPYRVVITRMRSHPPTLDERRRVRARWRSFVVSSVLSHGRSSAISAAPKDLPRHSVRALDLYRSINAVVESFFKSLKSEWVGRTVFHTRSEDKEASAVPSTTSTTLSSVIRRSTTSIRLSSKGWPDSCLTTLH
jgi:hypothetical protein